MFTGIIEEIGEIVSLEKGDNSLKLKIKCASILDDILLGDSIATNGVCLTTTEIGKDYFIANVMGETLNISNFSSLKIGSLVNLERALTLNKRLGGHLVSGHIDGVGEIISITRDDIAYKIKIKASREILKYIIYKGSIAINGISLTVSNLFDSSFEVSIIPHTANNTTFKNIKVYDFVNLECDALGKYIERLLDFKRPSKENSKITLDYLESNGFM